MNGCRGRAPDFERKFVIIRWPLADAHPSVRKGANFPLTGKSRSWVGERSEKIYF